MSASQTAAARALKAHVSRRTLGRLSVGAGAGEIAVYLLDGHVVAAVAMNDVEHLVTRFEQAGYLPGRRANELKRMTRTWSTPATRGERHSLMCALASEIPEKIFETVLKQRFEENLSRYLGNRTRPRLEDRCPPWLHNVRTSEPSIKVIDRCMRAWIAASSLDDSQRIDVGEQGPRSSVGRRAVKALSDGPMLTKHLASELMLESVAARYWISALLKTGVLKVMKHAQRSTRSRASAGHHSVVSDEELDAFSGAMDQVRGSGNEGTFVTQSHNLDRIELGDISGVSAKTTRADVAYAAPTLKESDAKSKVEVANEVLGILAKAIDVVRGPSRGAGIIQLMVDGRPRAFVPLFESLQVQSNGHLPHDKLLVNLRKRPATEQRTLLNQGLLDLLNRALDKAADELPEAAFDAVLEKVMGYRQRLGL